MADGQIEEMDVRTTRSGSQKSLININFKRTKSVPYPKSSLGRLFWIINHPAILALTVFLYGFITVHHKESILENPLTQTLSRSFRGGIYTIGGAIATMFLPRGLNIIVTSLCIASSVTFVWPYLPTISMTYPLIVVNVTAPPNVTGP